MQNRILDRLEDFEFHDAELRLESCEGDTLILSAKALNLRRDSLLSMEDGDMEILSARLTFSGFDLVWYEPGRVWRKDAQGQLQPVGEQIHLENAPGMDAFLTELRAGTTVFSLHRQADHSWVLGGAGSEPYFEVCFRCGSSAVEWDAFKGPAWYACRQTRRIREGK